MNRKKVTKTRNLKINIYKKRMEQILNGIEEPVYPEYKFLEDRRFRFDYAIPDKMIAIEYEGVMGGNSRHTNRFGYTKDTEKYNLAAINGWKVLRYTALNINDLEKDLKKVLSVNNEASS